MKLKYILVASLGKSKGGPEFFIYLLIFLFLVFFLLDCEV